MAVFTSFATWASTLVLAVSTSSLIAHTLRTEAHHARASYQAEYRARHCAAMQAAHLNLQAAAVFLNEAQSTVSPPSGDLIDWLDAASLNSTANQTSCHFGGLAVAPYLQMNPALPRTWPNWHVRFGDEPILVFP